MRRGNGYKVIAILALLVMGINPAWAEKFSIVVLPDTQFYSANYPARFKAQTDWIVANQADGMDGLDDGKASNNYPIIYVAHLGDLVSNGYCKNNDFSDDNAGSEQWANAVAAMDILRKELTIPSDDIPHGVLPGNHDFDQESEAFTAAQLNGGFFCQERVSNDYNRSFGPGRFASTTNYGGNTPLMPVPTETGGVLISPGNDNNYTLFESPNGMQFIAINFAYTTEISPPSDEILNWADNLLTTHSVRNAIITSHFILEESTPNNREDGQTVFGAPGVQIYDKLKKHPNLFLMLSGHRYGEAWRTETREGMNEVQVLLSNYQHIVYPTGNNIDFRDLPTNYQEGGNSGFMRIMRFDTDQRMVAVTTFAPKINEPGILESTNTLTNGFSMSASTASNFSFSFNPVPSPPSDLAPQLHQPI